MRRELIYSATVGGCVEALMTMALGLVLPLGAQSQSSGNFGKTICTQLEVVSNGNSKVEIGSSENGGYVVLCNKRGMPEAAMQITESGGLVNLSGVRMHAYEHGVGVHVYDQEGNERAGITATESGVL